MNALTRFALAARMPDEVLDLEALTIGVASIGRPAPEGVSARLDALAKEVEDDVHPGAAPDKLAAQLRQAFAGRLGFHGDPQRYDEAGASFIDEVLARRRGLPILLSVVWILLSRRLGVPVVGIGYPGHFIVALDMDGARIYLDPFHGGVESDAGALMRALGPGVTREVLNPTPDRAIAIRMLTNLRNQWESAQDFGQALEALDRIQLLAGERPLDVRDRGLLLLHLDRETEAQRELRRYIKLSPEAPDRANVERLLQRIAR